jgi:inositol oxygenase
MNDDPSSHDQPLHNLEDWEADLLRRYPEPQTRMSEELNELPSAESSLPNRARKDRDAFRNYQAEARPSVKTFYQLNHCRQTYDFVQTKRDEYLPLRKKKMGVWEAMEFLNTLIDDSDPDTELSQIEHLLQTAEAIRADAHPRWFILAGLIHDLGKILCLMGEPQWAVVGDTFPVGCAYSPKVVYYEFFQQNPDWNDPRYSTRLGIYQEKIGLDQVVMSWGHDEYLYQVIKYYLPIEARYMIRYHSFYAAYRERDYEYLFNDRDHQMFQWVRRFNEYDLYSKSDQRPDTARLRPFYQELIDEYFPSVLCW